LHKQEQIFFPSLIESEYKNFNYYKVSHLVSVKPEFIVKPLIRHFFFQDYFLRKDLIISKRIRTSSLVASSFVVKANFLSLALGEESKIKAISQ